MAFDIQTLVEASRCAECASPNQKQNVLLYLLNGILENGAAGGGGLHNLLSLTHPDTVPGPPLRGSLVVGNATPDWEALLIGAPGTFLGSDGTDAAWAALPGGLTGFANPTAQVGLVAVNGVATAAMRSDAAPALDQGIVPTWTGAHTWNPADNITPITVTGYGLTGANAQSLLDLSGTWNTTGSPTAILLNITSTAAGSASLLMDIQRDSLTRFKISRTGFGTFTRQEADVSAGGIALNKRGTTGDSTAAIANTSSIAGIEINGWDGAAFGVGANIRAIATETWTAAGHGTSLVFSIAAVGSITTPIRFTLTSTAFAFSPHGVAAGNTSELRFLELAAGGVNYTGFKAPDAITNSEIYVLPNAAPAANRFLQAAAVAGGVSALSWTQVSLTADVTGILPVANGGSGTSTAFTQGSVIFAGPAGVFAQDNANFFWDDTNNRLGIGTAVPDRDLGIVKTQNGLTGFLITNAGTGAFSESAFNLTENGSSKTGGFEYLNDSLSFGAGFESYRAGGLVLSTGTGSAGGISIVTAASSPITFATGGYTAANERMRILGTGEIGIGVIVPLAKFHVTNSAAATVCSIFKAAAAQSANITEWQNSAGTVLTCVDEVGNIGIGTTQPGTQLTIGGSVPTITIDTADGADTKLLSMNGGGAASVNRGGQLTLYGNEHATLPGVVSFFAGNVAGGDVLFSTTPYGAGQTLTLKATSGNVGIGIASPTAALHLRAGVTTASRSPLKFTTGISMTAAEAGAMEFTTDDLFFTITTGAARKRLLMADATAGLTSGKIPVATTNGRLIDITASAAYTPTNVTTDRAYDANATSVDELADVLGTVIADLQTKGILG